jgi:N-acetylneuraminic acid mutarotase
MAMVLLMTACTGKSSGDSLWTEHESMRVARSEHPAVVLDGEIVVLGGFVEVSFGRISATTTVEAYDPGSDSWRDLPNLPESRHHLMAAVVSSRLFVIGGFTASGDAMDTVWELVDGEWMDRAPIPVATGAGAAVNIDGAIYVVGGAPAGGLLRYDSTMNVWEVLAPPSSNREHLAAAVLDGEVWALGGRWHGEAFDTTEIYDPENSDWRNGPKLIEPRSGFGASVMGSAIIVAGGEVFDPVTALSSVELLGPDGWQPGESLPFGLHGSPLVTLGDRVYLPGGSTRAAGVDNPGTMLSLQISR